jgi:uncharacterized integral membrane protein
MALGYLIVALLAATVAVFALQNSAQTSVRFLVWTLDGLPVAAVALISLGVGLVVSGLPLWIRSWRWRSQPGWRCWRRRSPSGTRYFCAASTRHPRSRRQHRDDAGRLEVLEALVEPANSVGFALLAASTLVPPPVSLAEPAAILVVRAPDPAVDRFEVVRHGVGGAREPQLNHPNVHRPLNADRGVLTRLVLEEREPFVGRLGRDRDAPLRPVASGGGTGSLDVGEAGRLE